MSLFVRPLYLLNSSTCNVSVLIRRQFGAEGMSQLSRKRNISRHLVLNEAPSRIVQGSDEKRNQPVVILYEWLGAKPTAVDKYCNLYHKRGLDVITVKGTLRQFLQPENGYQVAREILDYLDDRQAKCQKESYIVHAFSIGAFNHTLCLMTARDVDKYSWFPERICASVFDSIVIGTLDNMTSGMSISISQSKIIQSTVRLLCMSYFSLRKDQIKFYDTVVQFYRNNPVIVPTQYFYSRDDLMCDTESLGELVEFWRRKFPAIDLHVNSWDKSAHAAHIKFHEVEYKTAMDNFFKKYELVK